MLFLSSMFPVRILRPAPQSIEEGRHDAIQKANFVWLQTPDLYVGPSAALEGQLQFLAIINITSKVGLVLYASNRN